MKIKLIFALLGAVPLAVSCASTPLVLAPVGPNPSASRSPTQAGGLQVFSELVERNDDQNQAGTGGSPSWYQHTDYDLYDAQGKLLKRVNNSLGHYETQPRVVWLPPGAYSIRARAKAVLSVAVPVEIQPGRTTRVHLDEQWQPPTGTLNNEVVSGPDGAPVGWRAGLPQKF
jgi:hypothetical protein